MVMMGKAWTILMFICFCIGHTRVCVTGARVASTNESSTAELPTDTSSSIGTTYAQGSTNVIDYLVNRLYGDLEKRNEKQSGVFDITLPPVLIPKSVAGDNLEEGIRDILSLTPPEGATDRTLMRDVAALVDIAAKQGKEKMVSMASAFVKILKTSLETADEEVERALEDQIKACGKASETYESLYLDATSRYKNGRGKVEFGVGLNVTSWNSSKEDIEAIEARASDIDDAVDAYDGIADKNRRDELARIRHVLSKVSRWTNAATAAYFGPYGPDAPPDRVVLSVGKSPRRVKDMSRKDSCYGDGDCPSGHVCAGGSCFAWNREVFDAKNDDAVATALLQIGTTVQPYRRVMDVLRSAQERLTGMQKDVAQSTGLRGSRTVVDVANSVPAPASPIPSKTVLDREIETDEAARKIQVKVDGVLLREINRRREHLRVLCAALNETLAENAATSSSLEDTIPSRRLISDVAALFASTKNAAYANSAPLGGLSQIEAVSRALPSIAKDIRNVTEGSLESAVRIPRVSICIAPVQSGDSAASLAEKWGMTKDEFEAYNPQLSWRVREGREYPTIGEPVYVPSNDKERNLPCRPWPCAVSPSAVCEHGGIPARGPEGTKPGFGWLRSKLGRLATKWASEAAIRTAKRDWDLEAGDVAEAEGRAVERVAKSAEAASRLFATLKEDAIEMGRDMSAPAPGLDPAPQSGHPVESLTQLDDAIDELGGRPVHSDILAADMPSAFVEVSSKRKRIARIAAKKSRARGADGVLQPRPEEGTELWVYFPSSGKWRKGQVGRVDSEGLLTVAYSDGGFPAETGRVSMKQVSFSAPSEPGGGAPPSSSKDPAECDPETGPKSASCEEIADGACPTIGEDCVKVTEFEFNVEDGSCCLRACNFKDKDGNPCSALAGANLDTSDAASAVDIAASAFTGALCDDMSEPCPDLDCSGHGSTKKEDDGKVVCECDDGYTGENCADCLPTHFPQKLVDPDTQRRGFDDASTVCRRCAPEIIVARAEDHSLDAASKISASSKCEAVAQLISSIGEAGSGAGLWAQEGGNIRILAADLFIDSSVSAFADAAQVEVHDALDGMLKPGVDEKGPDTAVAIGRYNGTDVDGFARFAFTPFAPLKAGGDYFIVLRALGDAPLMWRRGESVVEKSPESVSWEFCDGKWRKAKGKDAALPKQSFRLHACTG